MIALKSDIKVLRAIQNSLFEGRLSQSIKRVAGMI